MKNLTIKCGNANISNDSKFCLIAGPCQLESEQHAMDMSGKIKEIAEIAEDHKITLVEDASESLSASLDDNPVGSFGDSSWFSFAPTKIISTGEGGMITSNNEDLLEKSKLFRSHGRVENGNYFSSNDDMDYVSLGYNFRISELHAAVGLAQLRRLDEFVAIQKANYTILRDALSVIPEVKFRTVPDGGEESYSFLSFFLPDLETTRLVSSEFKNNGVDACFHYYDNSWHYIRKWEHLKELKTLYPLPKEVKEGLSYLKDKKFPKSDHYIGRNISCLIKLSWTEEEVRQRAAKMLDAITKAL